MDATEYICGPDPLVPAFDWARPSEPRGFAEYSPDDAGDLPDKLATLLVWRHAPEVADALLDQNGDNMLVAALWASSSPGVRFSVNSHRGQRKPLGEGVRLGLDHQRDASVTGLVEQRTPRAAAPGPRWHRPCTGARGWSAD